MTARIPLRSPHHALPAAAALTLAALVPAQQRLGEDRATGAATVTVEQCKQWLGTLAGPEFEGRGTGQPGFEKAARFVAAHFQSLGLEARGDDGSWFQHVPWGTMTVVADKTALRFTKGGTEVLRVPAARLQGNVSAPLAANGDCVLLAVDVPAPEQRRAEDGERPAFVVPEIAGLDDVDVEGKVAVVLLRQQGERTNAMGAFAVASKLQGKSPAAVVLVQQEPTAGGLVGRRGPGRNPRNPAVGAAQRGPAQITFGGDDCTTFLAAAGIAKDTLATLPTVTALPLRAEVAVAVDEARGAAANVFAVLPGSDPKLRDEYVVIGSHLDHLGKDRGLVFPGADDDASGTTGVLAVAQMFVKNPVRPARSVLFVCFTGEERGLRGSGHFADNCPVPLPAIVAELQMDMIGRDEEEAHDGPRLVNVGETAEQNRNTVHLVGTRQLAPALHELCLRKNETAAFEIEYDQEDMFRRSDHVNFARKGVPVAFFFTGLHRDYHQTTDTPDKIHYEKLLRVATWVYDIAFELATQPDRPRIDPTSWSQFRRSNRNQIPETPAAPLLPPADAEPSGGKGKGEPGAEKAGGGK